MGKRPWYDDYNAVKHDREMKFTEVKLADAIEAIAAVIVLLAAQFGSFLGIPHNETLMLPIKFVSTPNWDPEHWYCHNLEGTGTRSHQNYAF